MGALLIAAAIVFLIVYDVMNGRGFSDWWAKHAITTSLVSDLLIVGATALIFDEVQAYRQRKDRSVSVAAQALIVYGQAREAYQAVLANVGDLSSDAGVPDELRDLAGNLLVASPSLFDDPDARDFLLQLDRLMASLYATVNDQTRHPDRLGPDRASELTDRMNQVQSSFDPLVARFPPEYQRRVRDTDNDIASDNAGDTADGSGSDASAGGSSSS